MVFKPVLLMLSWIGPVLLLGMQLALAADETAEVERVLAAFIPDAKPDSITPAPIPGVLEVAYGPTLIYLSKDGRYLLQGDLLDVKERRNLTEETRAVKRLEAINTMGEEKMIVFSPPQVKHTINVFTDIDCGYCRKLHQEIAQYNEQGIKVRYLAFPRSGPGSDSFDKAVSVWCATDKQTALTRAKAGEEVEKKRCDSPVKAQYELGKRMGITGTPTILLEDGTLRPGYIPAPRLALMLATGKGRPDDALRKVLSIAADTSWKARSAETRSSR
jgi:thiol:disulfide interchange protein DsbC